MTNLPQWLMFCPGDSEPNDFLALVQVDVHRSIGNDGGYWLMMAHTGKPFRLVWVSSFHLLIFPSCVFICKAKESSCQVKEMCQGGCEKQEILCSFLPTQPQKK